jgi:hypothetical protein
MAVRQDVTADRDFNRRLSSSKDLGMVMEDHVTLVGIKDVTSVKTTDGVAR